MTFKEFVDELRKINPKFDKITAGDSLGDYPVLEEHYKELCRLNIDLKRLIDSLTTYARLVENCDINKIALDIQSLNDDLADLKRHFRKFEKSYKSALKRRADLENKMVKSIVNVIQPGAVGINLPQQRSQSVNLLERITIMKNIIDDPFFKPVSYPKRPSHKPPDEIINYLIVQMVEELDSQFPKKRFKNRKISTHACEIVGYLLFCAGLIKNSEKYAMRNRYVDIKKRQ